jgi:hypothetical protein
VQCTTGDAVKRRYAELLAAKPSAPSRRFIPIEVAA